MFYNFCKFKKLFFLVLFFLSILSTNCFSVFNYLLTAPSYNPGFFSTFNTVLGVLDYYDSSKEFIGLEVNFRNVGWYYDKTRGENWWQYYFEPIKLKKGEFAGVRLQEFPDNRKGEFSLRAEFDMPRKRGHELIQKYIHLKPHIQSKIDQFVTEYFKNYKIIGIHYRGTDKVSEAPRIPYEKVCETIKKDIIDLKTTKIFIATDDNYFLNYMRIKYPENVICLDAIRSSDGHALHTSIKYDRYKIGEDAIIDCVLLSKCSKLYKTASNLSDTSVKFNPNIPFVNLSLAYHHRSLCKSFDLNFLNLFDPIE